MQGFQKCGISSIPTRASDEFGPFNPIDHGALRKVELNGPMPICGSSSVIKVS